MIINLMIGTVHRALNDFGWCADEGRCEWRGIGDGGGGAGGRRGVV